MAVLQFILENFLAPTVVAAVVSAFVSILTVERRIDAENVLQERKKWRSTIRRLGAKVHTALAEAESDGRAIRLDELRAKFTLHLNPHDQEDQDLLALIDIRPFDCRVEFGQRVALLLKHDWERAKREANLWRWMLERAPKRLPFSHFDPGRPHKYSIHRLHECRVFWLGDLHAVSDLRLIWKR